MVWKSSLNNATPIRPRCPRSQFAVWIGMLGLDFAVQEPPELVDHLRVLAERYARALPSQDAWRTESD